MGEEIKWSESHYEQHFGEIGLEDFQIHLEEYLNWRMPNNIINKQAIE